MLESRRKFKRFDLPLGVKFRPTYGAKDYSRGAAMNLSCDGLGLNAHDFRFFIYENLELIIETAGKGNSVSLFGDVLWKRQAGERCVAGIKFRMKDESLQKEAIEKIFSSSEIPVENMYTDDLNYIVHEETKNIPVSEPAGPNMKSPAIPNKLGFIKQYHESGTRCTVTFRLIREMAKNIRNVTIVGDFNNWDVFKSPMTRLENGDFVITMELDSKREYKFRYLIDGHRWESDWYADRFVRNKYGFKDSVVIV